MTSPFDFSGPYYDLLYQDKDTLAEVSYIENLINKYNPGSRDILEFGSGTGRHSTKLAAKGFRVHGIELSKAMLEATPSCDGFSCQLGDVTTTKLSKTFDSVISIFHVVSYQTSNELVQSIFANAFYHLNPGGIFIFDVWYTPAVYTQKPLVRIKRLQDDSTQIVRISEPTVYPNENKVDVKFTIMANHGSSKSFELKEELHSMRHFSLLEIDLFANAAGFERILAEEWLTSNKPSEDTWGVCIVLRKK